MFAPSPWILRLSNTDRSEETMRRRLVALGWTEVREGVWRVGPDEDEDEINARGEGDDAEEKSATFSGLSGNARDEAADGQAEKGLRIFR